MSFWTSVIGVMDVMKIGMTNPDWVDLLGKPYDGLDEIEECHLPCGSDGSLDWAVLGSSRNSTPVSSAVNLLSGKCDLQGFYVVSFYGTLRDFNDDTTVIKYFEDTLERLQRARNPDIFVGHCVFSIIGEKHRHFGVYLDRKNRRFWRELPLLAEEPEP